MRIILRSRIFHDAHSVSIQNAVLNRYPESMVADYPPDFQSAYYKYTGREKAAEKLTMKNDVAKAIFMVVAFFVVVFPARLAGADSFREGFLTAAVYTLTIRE